MSYWFWDYSTLKLWIFFDCTAPKKSAIFFGTYLCDVCIMFVLFDANVFFVCVKNVKNVFAVIKQENKISRRCGRW